MDHWTCALCLLACLLPAARPSAIPMWEFLSRDEKMNHLFNMFTKQVTQHCDTSTMPDCHKVLMVYGLHNLAKMGDDSLDQMDPYQRGAMDLIWDHMMQGESKTGATSSDAKESEREPMTSDNRVEASSNVQQYAGAPQPVMGPMVVRVFPDGRPVPDHATSPPPRDEDMEEHMAMRVKPLPSMLDLLRGKHPHSH